MQKPPTYFFDTEVRRRFSEINYYPWINVPKIRLELDYRLADMCYDLAGDSGWLKGEKSETLSTP